MKSLVKVEQGKDGSTILSLAIKLPADDKGVLIYGHKEQGRLKPQDLKPLYDKYGISIMLAYLRSYIWAKSFIKIKPRKKKRNRK